LTTEMTRTEDFNTMDKYDNARDKYYCTT
jgi:hypothetical protein